MIKIDKHEHEHDQKNQQSHILRARLIERAPSTVGLSIHLKAALTLAMHTFSLSVAFQIKSLFIPWFSTWTK